MKKAVIIALGVFILSLCSCTVKTEYYQGFPLAHEEIIENFDYFISILEEFGDSNAFVIDWVAKVEPVEYSLSLGGLEISDLSWVYKEEDCLWLFTGYIDESLLDIEDHLIHFDVGFNGNVHQGVLRLSPEIICESVVEFHFNADLDICWEADYEPQLFNLSLDHGWLGYEGNELVHYNYQLSDDASSYHLDQSYFTLNTVGGFECLLAEIKAVNYYQEKKFMIYSYTENNIFYDNFLDR